MRLGSPQMDWYGGTMATAILAACMCGTASCTRCSFRMMTGTPLTKHFWNGIFFNGTQRALASFRPSASVPWLDFGLHDILPACCGEQEPYLWAGAFSTSGAGCVPAYLIDVRDGQLREVLLRAEEPYTGGETAALPLAEQRFMAGAGGGNGGPVGRDAPVLCPRRAGDRVCRQRGAASIGCGRHLMQWDDFGFFGRRRPPASICR